VATEIHRQTRGRHLLLLTDFDGTLADLAPRPGQAFAADSVRAEADAISRLESVTFGVVSGRRLADVRTRVGPAAEFVAGLHGLEIEGPGVEFHHQALRDVAPVLRRILQAAERDLAWCPGLLLEDKTYALTCHVRLAPPDLAERALDEFEAIAEPEIVAHVLKTLPGAAALELLPSVDWHKGRAVEWIRSSVQSRVGDLVVVYLGDDRTDEDAFQSLGDDDLAVGVGDRTHTDLIDWRLAGPLSVGRLLGFLARFRSGLDDAPV
jgi:trehalose-phosphatase